MSPVACLVVSQAPVKEPRSLTRDVGTLPYLTLCGVSGGIACGLTRTLLTPLDLLNTRMRTRDSGYRSLRHAFLATLRHEGLDAFARGWVPTLAGQTLRGTARFGLYESLRAASWATLGDKVAFPLRPLLYALSAAAAESVAVAALCPFEAVKLRMQTHGHGRRAPSTWKVMSGLTRETGVLGLYAQVLPQWRRQVPRCVLTFVAYELSLEALYKGVFPIPNEKRSLLERLLFVGFSGYLAGIVTCAALLPVESVEAEMSRERGLGVVAAVRRLGVGQLWNGYGRRAGVLGSLTAAQFLVYDGVKALLGVPRPPPPHSL